MSSAPIPRRLLTHSATLESFDKTVGSNPTYKPVVTLRFVRFEVVKQNAAGQLGEANTDKFTMYIDARNTTPVGVVLAKKDRVNFNGLALIVREIRPTFGFGPGVHHYEVRLG